jgi:cardiolipin synthase
MDHTLWVTAALVADWLIRVGLSLRVIMRRLPVGTALAWLSVILILPFVGAGLYLLVGEYRLGPRRRKRAAAVQGAIRARLAELRGAGPVEWTSLGPGSAALARMAEAVLSAPALPGNRLELLPDADAAFPALIKDIDQARRTCHLEFYIWDLGGRADEVVAAVIRAAGRGVVCRVLVDAQGSGRFLRCGLVGELRRNGVEVRAALSTGLLRILFIRPDLRLHRKIAVIDGEVAYTGSMNLADPKYFKQGAGVGQWVDALVRLQGPAVEALAVTFDEDWVLESGAAFASLRQTGDASVLPGAGRAAVQVLPSGPDERVEAIEQVVLTAVYAATRELVMTTPYFVPSESLLTALLSAAARGVEVTLIVPARIDSRLVHFASRAHQVDLLTAGARVALFQGGLLHTKSITVDGQLSLFGSLNLDPRSFRLDFEITLVVYDADYTASLRRLQQSYLDRSELLDLAACRARSALERFSEQAARLVGPVL